MITTKDLYIINAALAQYESLMEHSLGEHNFAYESHKENYGDPNRTTIATRRRVHQEINKRIAKNGRSAQICLT